MEAGATHGSPLVLSLDRADVGCRAWTGEYSTDLGQGVGVTFEGGMGREAPPQIPRGASE